MKRYLRKVTSLDQSTIKLGKSIAARLGLSFSALVRMLINQQSESLTLVTSIKKEELSKSA